MNIFKKPECHIIFNEGKHRHRHKLKDRNKKSVRYPTFFSEDDISGKIELIKTSSSFDYSSITIELIGLIEYYKNPKDSVRFLSLKKDISKNGSLSKDTTTYNFIFNKVKFFYESYKGDEVGVKYSIKVNIIKMMRTISYEEEFVVVRPDEESILKKNDEPITMNVGIKDLLSILIEFEHVNYSIHGTLKGFVSFGKVNLLLTKMEVQLIKKETIFGVGAQKRSKPKVIATFELIDGGPYKNETIPFRFFLEPYHLTPSYTEVAGNFSVRYYLNLIIKDNQYNKYFKQKEIFLYRLYLSNKKNSNNTLANNYLNNKLNDVDQLKDYITEPIDFGDYFSVFNDIDEEKDNSKEKIKIKGPEPDDFYYRSSLTGLSIDKDEDNIEENETFKKELKFGRSNTTTNVRNKKQPQKQSKPISNNNKITTNRSILNDNNYINNNSKNDNNNKKSNSVSTKNNNNKPSKVNNQVINIKEKNKYKNNDILINDNYYNTDNYIIYQNSYHNVFDNKLMQKRIKNTNINIEDKEDEKEINNIASINDDNDDDNIITTKNVSSVNSINDYNLYYPDEPFSNNLILTNFPTNYTGIGQSDNFRQNLMGSRIKKK